MVGGFSGYTRQLKSVAESGSALLTASFQYLPSICSRHSFTEAVFFASLAFLGLISSDHPSHLPFDLKFIQLATSPII